MMESLQVGLLGIEYFVLCASSSYIVDRVTEKIIGNDYETHTNMNIVLQILVQIAIITILFHVVADHIIPNIPLVFSKRVKGIASAKIISAFALMLYADHLRDKIKYLHEKREIPPTF